MEMTSIRYNHTNEHYLFMKRVIDICCAIIGIILVLPVLIIIVAAIKVSSKGSIIYKHKRTGYLGREIIIYKFRTMIPDAQNMKKYLNRKQLKDFKENFKLKNDPRLTAIGKFLRNSSLDELPQLFNVLKGEMSIVGPRPVVAEELKKYGDNINLLLSVKPGLTGLWQVSGRSDTTYEERVDMDIEYIRNMNLLLDMKIILKTFVVVFKRCGAY